MAPRFRQPGWRRLATRAPPNRTGRRCRANAPVRRAGCRRVVRRPQFSRWWAAEKFYRAGHSAARRHWTIRSLGPASCSGAAGRTPRNSSCGSDRKASDKTPAPWRDCLPLRRGARASTAHWEFPPNPDRMRFALRNPCAPHRSGLAGRSATPLSSVRRRRACHAESAAATRGSNQWPGRSRASANTCFQPIATPAPATGLRDQTCANRPVCAARPLRRSWNVGSHSAGRGARLRRRPSAVPSKLASYGHRDCCRFFQALPPVPVAHLAGPTD